MRLLLKLNTKYSELGRPATFHCLKDVAVENFKYSYDNFFSNSMKNLQLQNLTCTRTTEMSVATKDLKILSLFMLLN